MGLAPVSGSDSSKTLKCKRPNCPSGVKARGLCSEHYNLWRRQRRERGEWLPGKVPTAPVVEHMDRLRELGIGTPRISELTGIHRWTLHRLYQADVMYADVAKRIMAVDVPVASACEIAADGAHVNSVGTTRRLQGLVALGFENREIAAELGMHDNHIARLIYGRRSRITARNASRVEEVARRLELSPPPDSAASRKAKRRAARNGWNPIFAWDEESIDDPTAKPAQRSKKKSDWWDSYLELREFGMSPQDAADRLGISWNTVYQRMIRDNEKKAA